MSDQKSRGPRETDPDLFNSPASFYRDDNLRLKASRLIGKKLRPGLVTSDLMQETLVVALKNVSDLLGKPKRHVYRWMIEVMRRRVLEHARSERTENAHQHRLAIGPAITDDRLDRLINAELVQLVMTCVDQLGDSHRQIFHLRYIGGKSVEEISRHLNKSEGSVRSSLYRTLRHVRANLEQAI